MIHPARASAAVLMAAVTEFSWGPMLPCGSLSADDPKAGVPQPEVTLFRGGPERTGTVSGSRLPEHPAVRWTRRLAGFPGDALLVDGVIYVGDVNGIFYAIKATDGSILWRFQGPDQIFTAPARRGYEIYLEVLTK